jgi:hypothetical protein
MALDEMAKWNIGETTLHNFAMLKNSPFLSSLGIVGCGHTERQTEAPDLRHHQRLGGHRTHREEEQEQHSVEVSLAPHHDGRF